MQRLFILFFSILLCIPIAATDIIVTANDIILNGALNYDPTRSSRIKRRIQFIVQNNRDERVTLFVAADSGQSNTSVDRFATPADADESDSKLDYQLYSRNNISPQNEFRDIGQIESQNNVMQFRVNANSSKVVNFFIVIPPEQFVEGGHTYSDDLSLKVYEGTFTNTPSISDFVTEVPFSIAIDVPPVISLQTGSSGSFSEVLNFGELSENETQEFQLFVVSNVRYHVRVQSDNKSFLVHEDAGSATVPDFLKVPYSLRRNKTVYDLSSGEQVDLLRNKRQTSGQNWKDFFIEIGDVSAKSAGKYHDTIHVDIIER